MGGFNNQEPMDTERNLEGMFLRGPANLHLYSQTLHGTVICAAPERPLKSTTPIYVCQYESPISHVWDCRTPDSSVQFDDFLTD